MANVIVTGHAGFIGKYVVQELLKHHHKVIGIDNYCNSEPLPNQEGLIQLTRDIRAGLNDQKSIDCLVHLAALPNVSWCEQNACLAELTHVGGTARLLQDAKRIGIPKVVFASSAAVYGDLPAPQKESSQVNPLSVYARHKVIGERLILASGLNGFCLRFFNVYGEGQNSTNSYSGVITKFLRCRQKGIPVSIYGDGSQTRDFVYASDVARAVRIALETSITGITSVNVGTGVGTAISQLAGLISPLLPFFEAERKEEVKHSIAETQKARLLLNYESIVSLANGLRLLW